MKEHTLTNLTDWPDDYIVNFKLSLKGETTRRRIESRTQCLQNFKDMSLDF